jgi:hypothetical protein
MPFWNCLPARLRARSALRASAFGARWEEPNRETTESQEERRTDRHQPMSCVVVHYFLTSKTIPHAIAARPKATIAAMGCLPGLGTWD